MKFVNYWVLEKLLQCFSKLLFDYLNWNNNDVCPTKSKTRKNWGEFQKRSARSLNKCWEINLLRRTWARVRITIVVLRSILPTSLHKIELLIDLTTRAIHLLPLKSKRNYNGLQNTLFTLEMRQHFSWQCVNNIVTKQSARNMVFEFVAESECYHYYWSSSTDQQIIFTPQLLPFSILPSFLPGSSFTTL